MARAHFFRPLTDATGSLMAGATITLTDADTGNVIPDQIFIDDTSASTLTNPFTTADGYVNFYLNSGKRIRLVATSGSTTLGVYLDIYPPASLIVVGQEAYRITNTSRPGDVLVASDVQGEALWIATSGLQPQIPPVLPRFLYQANVNWGLSYSINAMSTPSTTITLTIPGGAPWDGSGDDGTAVLTLVTVSARFLDGTDPRIVDKRDVDLSAVSNTYQYTVTPDTTRTVYWVLALDSTGATVFDWRRG